MEPGFCSDADQSGLGATSHELSPRRARGRPGRMLAAVHMGALAVAFAPTALSRGAVSWPRLEGWVTGTWFETRANSALLTTRCAHTAVPRNSFKHHNKLFFETGPKTSRNSAQRRRSPPSNRPASLLPLHRRRTSAGHLNPSGDLSMSKRIALLSAAA